MDDNLDTLEMEYREAQKTFMEERTPENKAAYKEAKQAFEEARVAKRQEQEADPNHPRGQAMVVVENDGEGEQ